MTTMNRQITLAARPSGYPKESDFKLVESPISFDLQDGQILVAIWFLSVDPYMRGRMNDAESYAPAVKIGEVMVGGAVGSVIESRNPRFQQSDLVVGPFGWQEYAISNGTGVRTIDGSLAPIPTALGILGMPGLTAYFGLLDICNPQRGETVVVSGAAGAVGSLVGQIARIKGCRVVGIAGGDDKVNYLTGELGFDAAFNYKTVDDYYAKLKELCPRGIDAYFDNVGGAITDAVFGLINTNARIAVCGQISQYNVEQPEMGPRMILRSLLVKQARAEGFLVSQFANRFEEGLKQMAAWLREGKLKYREDIEDGLENAPRAFIAMLKGRNVGKQLVKVAGTYRPPG
ncbi:MAG TPA: NADP-dependent oxidoreductase [Blastocatellia bacterium]|nr:NADP-dependent oxidoreductase [Blastocatellia bacterium]